MDHFQSGRPVLAEGTALAEDETEEFYDEADHDTVATIKDRSIDLASFHSENTR